MKTRRSIVLKLLLPNLVLFVLTAGILAYAVVRYRALAEAEIMGDNSFLTMEWQLLQNLKADTDRQLTEKDREIAELHERYAMLQLSGTLSPELSRLENELRKAEAEREDLLSRVFTGTANTEASAKDAVAANPLPVQAAPEAPSPRTGTPDIASAILRQRIRELEMELSESKALSSAVIAAEPVVMPAASPDYTPAILSYLRYASGELESSAVPGLQDIKTRILLRAIVNSPTIRADYPLLLDETDRFFASLAARERLKGKKEAYAAITEAVREISGK